MGHLTPSFSFPLRRQRHRYAEGSETQPITNDHGISTAYFFVIRKVKKIMLIVNWCIIIAIST
ncbi:hypothetical protein [aff. Roholtiella sp. LEGE 12411]|uniref:hypothetical protein n=1 Tax=aff. Roholtiella sp. LEGE 12411 TaxID=1828822 RepID=UPI00187EEEB5|nr:hypothetical protein [aff. Roholtiella sp. LEGE 12411]MBE9033846.1 hypothetical protein [aff. Roholtiella sp. LEGE 12411]